MLRAKRGPGVSSNIRHLWFCVLQNGKGNATLISKKKKKRSLFFHKLICVSVISMGPLMSPLKSMGPGVIVPPAPLLVALRASIMKAIYKPKPAKKFEGASQHFDLQKIVYQSKLSATSPTDVICDTTDKACILYSRVFHFFTIFEIKKAWVRI